MVGEHALDLVVGVLALLKEIAVVADVAALAVLILGADPGEIDELGVADAGYRHRLGENALGPFAVVEFLDLDAALLSLAGALRRQRVKNTIRWREGGAWKLRGGNGRKRWGARRKGS